MVMRELRYGDMRVREWFCEGSMFMCGIARAEACPVRVKVCPVKARVGSCEG